MLVAVATFVVRSSGSSSGVAANSFSSGDTTVATSALDQLSSADIAVNVAILTSLPETPSVINRADTVNAQLAVSSSDDTVIAKPQVVQTSLKSYRDIVKYTVQEGDTISSIAKKFGITSDSVRWSNGLQGDSVDKGKKLQIPPVNGIVYKVKDGDSVDSIVAKFSANKEQLVADNDLDIRGLPKNTYILVRDGAVASARAVGGIETRTARWGGAVFGYNGYDYGYCTWYAANRRAEAGNPIPANLGNASTWKALAQRAGYGVGNTPKAGAVIWTPPRDYYGHVGYVEAVNSDGSVLVSEMNTKGWAVRSTKTLSAADAARYSYIY